VAHVGEELRFVPAREEELAEASTARRTLEDLSCGARSTAFVLTPLSRADTAQLVRALTRIGTDAPTVARLEDHVWAMSEGNPFIAVEVTRALDQDNALALPTRVRDLVARRLDRLSTRSQQLVAVAAVIGRRFDFSLVRAASGMEEHDAAEAVEEAVRLRVLETVGDDLDFAHDRIRDVAYDRLLPLRRRLLHRAVVEALEALRREHRGEQIEQFAQHALRGELPEKAVHYLRQAGSRAVVRSALQDARVWLEQALATAETVPESSSTLEQAFAIRLELASVLTHLGEAGRVLEHLSEAETLAERLHDDARRGHVLAILSVTHSLVARLDEALVTGTAALEIARRLEDLKLRIATTTYLELAHYSRGDYERVVELATDNLAALPASWNHERLGLSLPPSIVNRAWLLLALAEIGQFAEAADRAAEAIRLADPTQHAYTIGWAHCSAGTLQLLRGDWSQARARMEHGINALRSGNVIFELSTTIPTSAWVLAELGEASEAQGRIREGEQIGEYLAARGLIGFFGWIYVALAHACLRLGRLDDAQRLGDRALESSANHPGYAARAHHLLGDVAIHPDRFDAAAGEAHYRTALAAAELRGMRPLVAHCHLGLATCYQRIGNKMQQAKEHLAVATTLYRDMGMAGWLEKAERETKTS
jgi:tetratricopeptide (TPR) repeat protein